MRTPKSSSMSAGNRPEKSTLSKTLRLTATIAALGASLGVSVENLIAAETAPKSETGGIGAVQDKHAPTPTPIPKVVAPMPGAIQIKDPLPATPSAAPAPVLRPKNIDGKTIPSSETTGDAQAPIPAPMKPDLISPPKEK